MEVKLLPHQLIGVSWMIDQERETPHKGGILADDMGLGKTVQMIATMAINQPSEEDKSRSTLIIVPAALLLQWKEELETRTNNIFDVHIQHGKDKIKDARRLQEKDVSSFIMLYVRPIVGLRAVLPLGCDHNVPHPQSRLRHP